MASQKQLYTRKLDEITRRYLAREHVQVQTALELLRQLRAEIAGQVTLSDNFDAFRLRELQANLARQIASLEAQLVNSLTNTLTQVATDGGLSVIEPLQTVGYTGVFFSPSRAQILTVSEFTADLIRDLTAEMAAKINAALRRAALGELTPFEIMEEISRIIGLKGKLSTGGIAARAENIVRTELARIYNLSSYNTSLDAANAIPGLLKRWVATGDGRTRPAHLEAHIKYMQTPIPVKQDFSVMGEAMRYPGDPRGSAANTARCRCRSVTIAPEIGVLSSPLDARVQKQLERNKV